jgi:hypothetical protein
LLTVAALHYILRCAVQPRLQKLADCDVTLIDCVTAIAATTLAAVSRGPVGFYAMAAVTAEACCS